MDGNEEEDEHGLLVRLWHKWHLLHNVLVAYGFFEFVTHMWHHWVEILKSVHEILELLH